MDKHFPLTLGEVNRDYMVVDIRSSVKIKRRLLDLGFVNSIVRIEKKSIKSGVFLLNLRGFLLALKRDEVECIMVKKIV